jgi:hypothetical protein
MIRRLKERTNSGKSTVEPEGGRVVELKNPSIREFTIDIEDID